MQSYLVPTSILLLLVVMSTLQCTDNNLNPSLVQRKQQLFCDVMFIDVTKDLLWILFSKRFKYIYIQNREV